MLKPKALFNIFKSKKFLVTLGVLIILVVSGIVLFSMSAGIEKINPFSQKEPQNDVAEAEDLVKKVGAVYLLPDEVPTIATVSDKTQLAGQPFFTKAENGDKVLIYKTAGTAILFRPSIEKIINVGPVNLEEDAIEAPAAEPEESSEPQNLSTVDVLILNGTSTVGLTQKAADLIEDQEFVEVFDRDDAVNKPYDKTVVVYSGDEFKLQAEKIAEVVSGSVEDALPDGEDSQGVEVVIILGEDFASK